MSPVSASVSQFMESFPQRQRSSDYSIRCDDKPQKGPCADISTGRWYCLARTLQIPMALGVQYMVPPYCTEQEVAVRNTYSHYRTAGPKH